MARGSNDQNGSHDVRQVSAYLRCHNADAAIHFYSNVFTAVEAFRLREPSGRVAHAELQIGPATIMVSDEYPEMGIMSPTSFDGTGVGVYLQVADVNSIYDAALKAGATSIMEPKDQFYGERVAKFKDPWGHEWLLGQTIENLSAVEMQERFDKICAEGK